MLTTKNWYSFSPLIVIAGGLVAVPWIVRVFTIAGNALERGDTSRETELKHNRVGAVALRACMHGLFCVGRRDRITQRACAGCAWVNQRIDRDRIRSGSAAARQSENQHGQSRLDQASDR